MRTWRILARREVRGWLLQPGHYVMAAAFLAASGLGFWLLAVRGAGRGYLTTEVTFGGSVFWLAVIAITGLVSTRPLAEERERGTLELLLTAPVRERDAVGAAYAGVLVWLMLACLPAVCAPWIVRLLAPGWNGMDPGAWAAGVVGLASGVAWLAAVGILASVVFRRQTAAAAVTVLTGLVVIVGGGLGERAGAYGLLARAGLALNASHAGGFADGFLDVRALTFAAVVAAFCLFAAIRWLMWSRYRRAAGAANLVVSLLLAGILGGILLTLAHRHPRRWDWSAARARPVSEHAAQVLSGLTGPVRVLLLGQADDPVTAAAWRVLERYPLASRHIVAERVDPERDLERARQLARDYGIDEAGTVVVQGRDRHRVVAIRRVLSGNAGGDEADRRTAAAGRIDTALASAVYAVSRATVPVVYFLGGHGERAVTDFGDYRGYGEIASRIRDLQAEVRMLSLDPQAALSNDCAALVVAGPSTPLSAGELARLREFVQRGGRLMLLLDSGTETGLEQLAAEWGIVAGQGLVVDGAGSGSPAFGPERSAAAGVGEVHVSRYGEHAVTKGFGSQVTTFHMPRPVEAADADSAVTNLSDRLDRVRVTVLAASGAESWVESDARQSPAQFDGGIDRRGPVGVAACVEKGVVSAVRVDLRPMRAVVMGDSQFAANRCLVGANAALFLNALGWLLDQENMAVGQDVTRGQFDVQLDRTPRRTAFALIVVVPPAAALACGVWVALMRRDRRASVRPGGGTGGPS